MKLIGEKKYVSLAKNNQERQAKKTMVTLLKPLPIISNNHLFFECPFSQGCWQSLQIRWNLSLRLDDMLMEARSNFNSKIFREVLIIGYWAIWCHKNFIIFNNAGISFHQWKLNFRKEIDQVGLRAKPVIKSLLSTFVLT